MVSSMPRTPSTEPSPEYLEWITFEHERKQDKDVSVRGGKAYHSSIPRYEPTVQKLARDYTSSFSDARSGRAMFALRVNKMSFDSHSFSSTTNNHDTTTDFQSYATVRLKQENVERRLPFF